MAISTGRIWLIAGVVFVVVVCWAGYRWARGAWTGLIDDTRVAYQQGRAHGQSLTATTCVDTALARHVPGGALAMRQGVREQIFLQGCLQASTPTALCDTVPSAQDVKGMLRFSAWTIDQCRRRGFRDRACPRVLQALARYCGKQVQPPA